MCGIAGIVGGPSSRAAVERMADRLSHRGPDDRGIWCGDGVALGHTRLSILDPSPAGHQPMTLGPRTIVYNGEIYNFPELREELSGPFVSDSDTEVLLHLHARDGADMVRSLRGMFSFAIWDRSSRTLFAARDRIGIKPFYYRTYPDGVAFASEVKALLELGRPSVDPSALRDFFTYGYIPFPKTAYSEIRQLPPAHTLTWDGSLRLRRYWTPDAGTGIRDPDEAAERLGALLGTAVPLHTLSDVPVGLCLSGGVDSATLAAHLDRPHTFTLGVDLEGSDERDTARLVAEHLGTLHHESVARVDDLDEAIETVPALYDEPFGDSAAWSTYLVSRMAREHVKVVLTGEGGDELFLGYSVFGKSLAPSRIGPYPLLARALPPFSTLAESMYWRSVRGVERYAFHLTPFTPLQKRAWLTPPLLEPGYDDLWHYRAFWRDDLEPLRRRQWMHLHTDLPGRLLTKVDRASMAHGLEARPPLLDHELVELVLTIDPRLLRDVDADRGKLLLRRLMEARLPRGLFDLPKRGFDLPTRAWVRDRPTLLTDAIERLVRDGILRRNTRPRLSHEQIWSLLVLDRWVARAGGL